MMKAKWGTYKNFPKGEFDCQHCGKNEMRHEFMALLQTLREMYGSSMVVTSGYRCADHPIEKKKAAPGAHSSGLAADIRCTGAQAYRILELVFHLNRMSVGATFTGIGVSLAPGKAHFIHLDIMDKPPRPNMWGY